MKKSNQFRTRLTAMILSLILIGCLLPATSAAADTTARVVGGWLRLRNAPSYGGRILSSYPTGSIVTITGQSGSWYSVIAPDGTTGYMNRNYLKVQGITPTPATGTTAWVTSDNGLNVRLRSGPSKRYSVIATYAPGTQCYIQSAGPEWSYIKIGSYTGYMMSRYLTSSATPVTPSPEPVTPASGEYDVWVTSRNGRGVNFRSGPSKSYHAIGVLSVGTNAKMVTYGPQWCYIRVGSQYGYMMTEFLTTTAPGGTPGGGSGSTSVYAYVTSANGRSVNLRKGPSKSYSVIRSFAVGTPLTVINSVNGWHYIHIGDYYGYMMQQYVQVINPSNQNPATQTDL